MKVHNLPKVVTKNDFPRLGVELGSLDPKANTLPTEPSRPRYSTEKNFYLSVINKFSNSKLKNDRISGSVVCSEQFHQKTHDN